MKITDVRAVPLTAKLPQVQQTSQANFAAISIVVVQVTTDNDLVGYGECLARFAPKAYVEIIHDLLRPKLIEADPFAAEGLWRAMYRSLSGRSGGVLIECIAGVDIALWDLMGKGTGQPIYKLLGGAGRKEIPAYASSIMVNDNVESECERLVALGFRMIKLKLSGNPDIDLMKVRAARRVLGDKIDLVVDANWAYDLDTAIRVGRGLAEAQVFWFEEPIVPEDREGYCRLRDTVPIRIAAGESEFTAFGARDLITSRSVGVIQPDVARAGGITETRRIALLADIFHVQYAPHVGFSGVICSAASLHLAAAMPNLLAYECMVIPNPLREQLAHSAVDDPSYLVDGKIAVPQGPGLGIEIDDEMLNRFSA